MSDRSTGNVLRGLWRACKMVALLLACDAHLLLTAGDDLRTLSLRRQAWSRRTLRLLDLPLTVHGRPPTQGVVVGNHLSYLDILTYGAVMDGVFVSKIEVRSWPLIGLITRLAGSIYVDRQKRQSLATASAAAAQALQRGLTLTFFPEGTSSGGSSVLRFHPGLFQAAVEAGAPIWPAAVSYRIDGKKEGVAEQVCYWGDMAFGPHMLHFLRLRNVTAEIRFAGQPIYAKTRVEAAHRCQAAVAELAGLPVASQEASDATMQIAMQSKSTPLSPR